MITAVFADYLLWHYRYGIVAFSQAWMSIHTHLYHFFSVPILVRHFFAPFRRLQEHRARGFNPENIFEVFLLNTVMRCIGVLMRVAVLIIALSTEIFVFILGALFFVVALTLPFIVPLLFVFGVLALVI